MRSTAGISPQSELGLGALRVLARWSRDWEPVELAAALDTRADVLAEIVARLVAAGWVHATVRAGRLTYRYADPQPAPTLYELIDALEGAAVADDCVLGLGTCTGLSGRQVCAAHDAWLRELGWSALIATPLLPINAAVPRSPDRAIARLAPHRAWADSAPLARSAHEPVGVDLMPGTAYRAAPGSPGAGARAIDEHLDQAAPAPEHAP